jgi:hypothetical protein
MREKFHYQTETREGASQSERNGVSAWWMKLLLDCVQARWALSNLRQRSKDGGILFDSPNEVMPATTQNVEWLDSVLVQKLLDGLFDWLLYGEDPLWIDERFRRIIEVDVFDIEIRNQGLAIPKGAADFEAMIQKRI